MEEFWKFFEIVWWEWSSENPPSTGTVGVEPQEAGNPTSEPGPVRRLVVAAV